MKEHTGKNKIFIVIIICLCAVIIAGLIYFMKLKGGSDSAFKPDLEVLEFLTSVMRGNVAEQFDLDPAIADRTKAAQLLMKRFNDDQRMELELTKLEIRFKESMSEEQKRDNFLDTLNATANEVWNN